MTGYSRRHLMRLLQQERVRTFDIGRKRFILATTLAEWARQREIAKSLNRSRSIEFTAQANLTRAVERKPDSFARMETRSAAPRVEQLISRSGR